MIHAGQRVRVEFEGTVTTKTARHAYVTTDRGEVATVNLAHVTVVEPAYWPPQVGDIWEAGGYEYMIRDARNASSTTRRTVGYDVGFLLVSPLDNGAPSLRGRLDELQAANPKLIRRRGGFTA